MELTLEAQTQAFIYSCVLGVILAVIYTCLLYTSDAADEL